MGLTEEEYFSYHQILLSLLLIKPTTFQIVNKIDLPFEKLFDDLNIILKDVKGLNGILLIS